MSLSQLFCQSILLVKRTEDKDGTACRLQNLLSVEGRLCSGDDNLQLGENRRGGCVPFCNHAESLLRPRTLQMGTDKSQAASVITRVSCAARLDAACVVQCPSAQGMIKQQPCLALEAYKP